MHFGARAGGRIRAQVLLDAMRSAATRSLEVIGIAEGRVEDVQSRSIYWDAYLGCVRRDAISTIYVILLSSFIGCKRIWM